MKRSKVVKKRSLAISVITLCLCCAALIGATFAWFTDTASTGVNRIVAGTLDVDLIMADTYNGTYTSIADGEGDIFSSGTTANASNATLWEPGATHIAYLGVKNNGSLAFKYNVYLNVTDHGLASALEYAIVPFGKTAPSAAIESWEAAKSATGVSTGTLESGSKTYTAAENGCLDEIANGTQEETDYFALVVHMKEDAGNEYQGKDVEIDINIIASQKDAEYDSFNNTYDENVQSNLPVYSIFESVETENSVKAETTDTLTFAVSGDVIEASLATSSAAALFTSDESADASKDMLLNLKVRTTEIGSSSVTYDLSLYKTITTTVSGVTTRGDAVKVSDTLQTYLTAQLQLASGLKNVTVTHSNNEMEKLASTIADPTNENGGYYYDSSTGVLYIKSKTFSPFKVTYTVDADAEVVFTDEDGRIYGYASFVEFKQMTYNGDYYFFGDTVTLLKDIDLSNANMDLFGANTSEIFAGTLDGANHSISGFNNICTFENKKSAFLFYYLYNATIKNLTIKDSTFDHSYYSSSMLGYQAYGDTLLLDNVHITNCQIKNGWENQFFIFAPTSDVTTIKNCSTDASCSMDCTYGNYGCWFRQACFTDFNMIDCTNNASMRGRGFVGVFVGQLGTNVYNASFTNCINNGEVRIYESSSANSRFLYGGGFIGYKNSSVEDTALSQTITFTDCKNNGNIIVEDVNGNTGFNGGAVGGYIGYTNGTTLIFNNCESNGSVGSSLIQRAAGFVGWENGTSTITFTNCKQTGAVTSNSTNGISGAYVAANNGTTNMTASGGTLTGAISGKTITKISGE